MALLEVEGLHVYYGHIHALRGVSLAVEEGEIVAMLGSNGAGKTTTLRTISGLQRGRQGAIRLAGQRIDHMPSHEIVALGIGHSPEGRRIFGRLTVQENLEMGAFRRNDQAGIRDDMERVLALFPRLRERIAQTGGTLSGGEQQMLAIGRAMMTRPRILLLDEPSMGLAPVLVESIFQTIQNINAQGGTVLLVEQNAYMALGIAHRAYVLQTGEIILKGPATELRENPEVKKAYLGG